MSYSRLATAVVVVLIFAGPIFAQPIRQQRKLGDGVLKVIPPQILPEETRTYFPTIKGFTPPEYRPETSPLSATSFQQSQNIILRREIGCLEFAFTPLTVKVIEVPQPSGKMQRKTVWYLPFRLRNLGNHYSPQLLDDTTKLKFKKTTVTVPEVRVEDKTGLLGAENKFYTIEEKSREESATDIEKITELAQKDFKELKDQSLKKTDQVSKFSLIDRFFGRFILEGRVQTDFELKKKPTDRGLRARKDFDSMSKYQKKSYLDRIMPTVVPEIRKIEAPSTFFYDTVSISRTTIPADPDPNSAGVWGVAVWEDLDPRLDFITIHVTGLSNAFKVFEMPDDTKQFKHKTLQLNFWRPGDIHDEEGDTIRYGIPLTRDPARQKEICQFYDLPGPVIAVEEFDAKTDKKRQIFSVEGKVDRFFDLDLQKGLDSGTLPDEIQKAFIDRGINVPAGVAVTKVVAADSLDKPGTNEGLRWEATINIDGTDRNFRFKFRPRSWQKIGDRVEIIKRVESVWTYR
jgi:hypothetical protein